MNELTFTAPHPAGLIAYVGHLQTMPHPTTLETVRRWHAFTIDPCCDPQYAGHAYTLPDATHAEIIAAFQL